MNARRAIREVAKQRGVSVAVVRAEIEAAIRDAWSKDNALLIAYQRKVPCKGDIPTPGELIEYIAKKLHRDGY